MKALDVVIMSALALGELGFAAWTVRVWLTSTLEAKADWTSWLVWQHGRAVVWLASLVTGGAVLGVVAHAVWRLVGA